LPVKLKRDLKNQLRGLLKNLGLVIGWATMNVFAKRAAELLENQTELAVATLPLVRAREAVEQGILDLDRKVLRLARRRAHVLLSRVADLSVLKDWGLNAAERSGLRKATVGVSP
jgi:hypothetical protein